MNNRWIEVNKSNLRENLDLMVRDDLIKLVIDGRKTHTSISFMEQIEKSLQFPITCTGNVLIFEDLIRDLSWLPKEKGVCIWITDYAELLKEDIRSKEILEEIFKGEVFPFWETDVTKYVKGGKPREFYVIVS